MSPFACSTFWIFNYNRESAQGVLFWKLTGCSSPFLSPWLPAGVICSVQLFAAFLKNKPGSDRDRLWFTANYLLPADGDWRQVNKVDGIFPHPHPPRQHFLTPPAYMLLKTNMSFNVKHQFVLFTSLVTTRWRHNTTYFNNLSCSYLQWSVDGTLKLLVYWTSALTNSLSWKLKQFVSKSTLIGPY